MILLWIMLQSCRLDLPTILNEKHVPHLSSLRVSQRPDISECINGFRFTMNIINNKSRKLKPHWRLKCYTIRNEREMKSEIKINLKNLLPICHFILKSLELYENPIFLRFLALPTRRNSKLYRSIISNSHRRQKRDRSERQKIKNNNKTREQRDCQKLSLYFPWN